MDDVFLETDRLVLRRFTAGDADLLVALDADPEVMLFINGGRATTREEIEGEVLPAFLAYHRRGQGYGAGQGLLLVQDTASVTGHLNLGQAAGGAGAIYQTGGSVYNISGAGIDGEIGGGG